jgi:membrane-associated phospholipid phosphatase
VLLVCSLGSLERADLSMAKLADSFHATWLPRSRVPIRLTHDSAELALAWVLLAVVIAYRRGRSWADIAQPLLALGVGLLVFQGCRLIFDRYRPGGPSVHPVPNSFPSGHVANAILCAVTAFHLVGVEPGRRDPVRNVALAGGALFVAAVCFTRVYFALHWLSDVVASVLFGLMFLGVAEACRGRGGIWRATAPVAVALALLYGAAACDLRVSLPSPPQKVRPKRTPAAPSAALSAALPIGTR